MDRAAKGPRRNRARQEAMAHEVRHLYVGPGHSASGLGTAGARLFSNGEDKFSRDDKSKIAAAIAALEAKQGNRKVAAGFATAERAYGFPF